MVLIHAICVGCELCITLAEIAIYLNFFLIILYISTYFVDDVLHMTRYLTFIFITRRTDLKINAQLTIGMRNFVADNSFIYKFELVRGNKQ